MIDEWTTRTLGSVLNGGIRHGVYKPLESFGTGTRVLKMGLQYSEDRIGAQEMSRVLLSDDELKRFQVREGDLLFSRTSMMSDGAGKCSLVVAHEEPFVFDGNILCGTPDTNLIDPAFVYFFFKSPAGKQAISEIIDGTQSRSLSGTNLAAVTVLCPPLAEQRAIAHILGTLDDKIELNRRMNATLEGLARTLYKSWFVAFEPVRAKSEGRDPGLPKPLADLFPDSFDESEFGKIPKGWDVGTLADYAELNPESWSRDTAPDEIEYVDLANTKWGKIEATQRHLWQDAPSRAQRILRPGDTIVGTVRPGNGSFAFISESGLTGSTGFAVLRPRMPTHRELVYLAATTQENIERLTHLADGAAYPAVRPDVVVATQAIRPNDAVVEQFALSTRTLMARMAANVKESHTLATLRDTVLPKLISRELRLEDAELFIGGAD